MPLTEEVVINQIAAQERAIAGIRNSYNYALNPDFLPNSELPAVLHYIPNFTSELRAHHNEWKNTLTVRSILFVARRQAEGGKLRFIENAAIPFGEKWRTRFQVSSTITDRLTAATAVKFFLVSGNYGAGGNTELRFGDEDFIGWIFSFEVVSA